jgi:CRP-like cAMP-binding protein
MLRFNSAVTWSKHFLQVEARVVCSKSNMIARYLNKSAVIPLQNRQYSSSRLCNTPSLPEGSDLNHLSFWSRSRDWMTKQRVAFLPIPRFLRKYIKSHYHKETLGNLVPVSYTISNLAGHGSFLVLALGYLESDLLNLRLFAFSGICLSVVFQYYREKPLWIPIRWNTLFLLINAVMITYLLKEKNDALNIDDEQLLLYKNVFERRGMNSVDFHHLITLARRMEFKKGDKLVDQNRKNSRVYLVVSGKLSVWKDSQLVGLIDKYQFVGEMSFLGWCNALHMVETLEFEKQQKKQNDKGQVTPKETPVAVVQAASPNEVPVESGGKHEQATKKFINMIKHQYHLHSYFTKLEPTLTTNSNSTTAEILDEKEAFAVNADVICEEDCTVFVWRFRELHELMMTCPSVGFVFERLLSTDLNKKITKQWDEETKLRYRQLLAGGLMDGEINELEKKILHEFRIKFKISLTEHEDLLKELGWTNEEYSLGYKM